MRQGFASRRQPEERPHHCPRSFAMRLPSWQRIQAIPIAQAQPNCGQADLRGEAICEQNTAGRRPFTTALGVMRDSWPFDQPRNTAAITTRQVLHGGAPVLSVTHYSDDHSWAFTCGTTNTEGDALIVATAEIVVAHPYLSAIADLPPGWVATRTCVEAPWQRAPRNDF